MRYLLVILICMAGTAEAKTHHNETMARVKTVEGELGDLAVTTAQIDEAVPQQGNKVDSGKLNALLKRLAASSELGLRVAKPELKYHSNVSTNKIKNPHKKDK